MSPYGTRSSIIAASPPPLLGRIPALCLCMIVKNEAHVLERCLQSVLKGFKGDPTTEFTFVICDTGSTDGTPTIIENFFKSRGIVGELYHDAWVDFAHNRTLAFERARGKSRYTMVIDADDQLVGEIIIPPAGDANEYERMRIHIRLGNLDYIRDHFFYNLNTQWRYVGVVHEYPALVEGTQPPPHVRGKTFTMTRSTCFIEAGVCGDRSRAGVAKFDRDIALLQKGLQDEPGNHRYHFYLAQSYKDKGDYERAIEWYKKRVACGGWEEEVYHSLYSIAICKERAGEEQYSFEGEVLYDYLRAFHYRRSRLEALYRICLYFRSRHRFHEAFAYGMLGRPNICHYPDDVLFVEESIHRYQFADELAVSAFYNGLYQLSFEITGSILQKGEFPVEEGQRLRNNLILCTAKIESIMRIPPARQRMVINENTNPSSPAYPVQNSSSLRGGQGRGQESQQSSCPVTAGNTAVVERH